MANLMVLIAVTIAALVTLTSAHTTIITTTIDAADDINPISQQECRQRLQGQELNQCQSYLQQGENEPYEQDNKHKQKQEKQEGLQQCCKELKNVEKQCQCEAVKKVFRDVQMQQQHQQGQEGGWDQKIEELKNKAQDLPNKCKLQTKQCQIGTVITTTITDSPFWTTGSKQCSKREVQGRVNRCQRYVEEQISGTRGGSLLLMSINKREQEQQRLEECCNELQNMRNECRCEAMKEVMRQVKQQGSGHGEYGGKQEEQMQVVRQVIQNLPNQCRLDVHQCDIPAYNMMMF